MHVIWSDDLAELRSRRGWSTLQHRCGTQVLCSNRNNERSTSSLRMWPIQTFLGDDGTNLADSDDSRGSTKYHGEIVRGQSDSATVLAKLVDRVVEAPGY